MSIADLKSQCDAFFDSGATKGLAWRRSQLSRLGDAIRRHEAAIADALAGDLGRPQLESYGTETGFLLTEIRHALAHVDQWAADRKVESAFVNFPSQSLIRHEPKGTALIIGPWNYPIQLALAPLVAAISAGCSAIIKPSELSPASSEVVARIVRDGLDRDAFAVVQGGVDVSTELLDHVWGHVFFTGSTEVGKIVMKAAARHLNTVTLELGGKSPVIVAADADIDLAAKRIMWGKGLNAGQTCIAPDYVLVERQVKDQLIDRIRHWLKAFYGKNPQLSPDFSRIINARHHARLVGLLDSGRVVIGGDHDAATRYLAPTVLVDVAMDAPVMQQEIFGPILPIIAVDNVDAAIRVVRSRPHPLALYLFTRLAATEAKVLDQTLSGGVSINDVISHIAVPDLPFGGVGPSGMGAYHGEDGFRAFSHARAVVRRNGPIDVPLRYPPYDGKLKWIRRIMR